MKELRTFLGMSSFCRKFIPNFARKVSSLYVLTRSNERWRWTETQRKAFLEVNRALTTPPVLACPDLSLPYSLYTDASGTGMGAALYQVQEGMQRVIGYASKQFNARKTRLYSTIEKEAAAVVWAIEYFRPYLKRSRFKILSDHSRLKWLATRTGASGRLGRWQAAPLECTELEEVEYLRGAANQVSDGLSRMPEILSIEQEDFIKMQEADSDFEGIRPILQRSSGGWTFKSRFFVPKEVRLRLLREFHKCHFGVKRTMEIIARSFFWPPYQQDVNNFIRTCENCVQRSLPVSQLKSLPHSLYPFQRVTMDFAGPFPRTKQGNRYFLVAQDDFSRFENCSM